jgi:hypothetical protein
VAYVLLAGSTAATGFVYPRLYPWLARWVMVLGILLLSGWAIGFGLAYVTGKSSILGPVAWGLLVAEHFAALTMTEADRVNWAVREKSRFRWMKLRRRHHGGADAGPN